METNQCKRINVSGHFFTDDKPVKISKRRDKTKKKQSFDNISDIKTENIKELLLQKLKQYKKERTRKNKQVVETPIDNNNIALPSPLYHVKHMPPSPVISDNYPSASTPNPRGEPLYGNLKNGSKPTMRQFIKKSKPFVNNTSKRDKGVVTVETERKYSLGRNKTMKTVGVFIKNNTLRRTITEEKKQLRNVKMKTIKNYLKGKNLIKYGSYAPNELLREIFDTSKLCGDVKNINGTNLVHNFMNES
tara:strand:- start:3065 stop:3805 length:741 start_codon:yes stop_codon:yes gene_type:complete